MNCSQEQRRQWHPTPVLLPGKSQGWGSWWAAVYGVAQSRAQLKGYSSSSSSSSSSQEIISSSAPDNFSTMDNTPPHPTPHPRIFLSAKGSIKITYSQGPSEEKLCVCVCSVRAPAHTCTRIISKQKKQIGYFLKFCKKISKVLLTNALELPLCSPYESESEVTQLCPTLYDHMDCSLTWLLCPWDFPGKSNGVGCCFLLQGIFPTQGLNPGLLYCGLTLLPAEPQGKPTLPL